MKTVLACYTGVSFIHFLFMTSLKNMSKDPTFKVGAMIVALTVMCAVGFFVLYFKSELDVQQTGQEIGIIRSQLENNIVRKSGYHQGMTTMEGTKDEPSDYASSADIEYVAFNGWDLAFKYPKDRFVALVDDSYVSGQKDVRITSSEGSLFLSGGVGDDPQPGQFTQGYQITLWKLSPEQNPVGKDARLEATQNPLVKRINFICDGAGCPYERYLITTKHGRYQMDVQTSDPLHHTGELTIDLEGIIPTISEK